MELEAAVAILAELVAFDVLSGAPNRALADHAGGRLARAGARVAYDVHADGGRVNVVASLGPEAPGGVVLCGHLDVVPAQSEGWAGDPFRLRRDAGRLIGRGAVDMKGFIACCLAAAPALAAMPLARPVHVVLTFDEEVGSFGAAQVAPLLGPLEAAAVIIGEPTGMRPITGHRAMMELTTEVTGTAGHASDPRGRVNAVAVAARMIGVLMEEAADLAAAPRETPFDPPWTTLSVGRIEGGEARNMIPDACAFLWEIRPLPGDDGAAILARIEARVAAEIGPLIAQDPAAGIATRLIAAPLGLDPRPDGPAAALIRRLWTDAPPEVVSFGTDAGYFQAVGIDTVVFGPGDIARAHRPEEYILEAELVQGLTFLERLGRHLCS